MIGPTRRGRSMDDRAACDASVPPPLQPRRGATAMRAGALCWLLLLAPAAMPNCVRGGPVAVARFVYLKHFDFPFHPARADGYVSSELLALLRKEAACPPQTRCALDWEPWTGAREGDVVGAPAFRRILESTYRAVVIMTYRHSADGDGPSPPLRETKVTLVRDGATDCWRIDDIEPATGGASLKKALFEFWGREI